jgi:hypothetical protein
MCVCVHGEARHCMDRRCRPMGLGFSSSTGAGTAAGAAPHRRRRWHRPIPAASTKPQQFREARFSSGGGSSGCIGAAAEPGPARPGRQVQDTTKHTRSELPLAVQLTYDITRATHWRQLRDIWQRHAHTLNAVHMSALAVRAAGLAPTPHDLRQPLPPKDGPSGGVGANQQWLEQERAGFNT